MQRNIDVKCPHCGADAKVESYSHYPGGRRLGMETILSKKSSECDCEWSRSDPDKAVEEKYRQ